MRTARITIAYYGWRIKKSQRWPEFGCANETEYCCSRGIAMSTWSSCMRVGQLLEALTFDQLQSIGIENGMILCTVNPDIWSDYDWLSDARSTPYRKFRELVAVRNQTLDGGEQSHALMQSQKRLVARNRLREIAREHNLATIDDALALALDGEGTTASAQLLAAAKHAAKLLTLVRAQLRKGASGSFTTSQRYLEAERLIEKTKKRLTDAVAIAVESVQAKSQ
jgi:hypothetical protein